MTTFGKYIGTPPPNFGGSPRRLKMPVKSCPAEGWDILTERLWVPFSPYFTRGTLRTDHEGRGTFYVQDETVVEWQGGCPVIELVSRGLADPSKPYKCTLQQSSLVDADTPYSSTWWKPDHSRGLFWGISLTQPDATLIGTALVPPETFGLPASAWSRFTAAVGVTRGSGWMLEGRQIDRLPGANAWAYQDTYIYDWPNIDVSLPTGSRDDL